MSGWTEERIEAFKALFAMGKSFGVIADEFGREHGFRVSKNACIGKAHRLGLPKRVSKSSTSEAEKVRRITKTGKNSFTIGRRSTVSLPPLPQREIPIPMREHACTLLDLENTNCRWPIWADDAPAAEQFFCGTPSANVSDGRPYCAYHANVAYTPRRGPPNISEAERMRRRNQGRTWFNGSGDAPEMMQAAE